MPDPQPAQSHLAAQWPHDAALIACRFEPKSRYVFSTSEDAKIERWLLADGKKTVLSGHESWVWCLGFSKDGETLYSGGSEGRLISWPVAADEPKPARTIEAHQGWIRCLAVSPDGQFIATAGNDRIVRLWNAADGTKVKEFAGHEVPVYSILWHPGGQILLSGDLRGVVKQWDVPAGTLTRSFDAKLLHNYNGGQGVDFGGVRSMALSPDGKFLCCGGLYKAENPLGAILEPLVLRFEWDSQKIVQQHIAEGLKGPLWRLVFLPDGTLVGGCGGSAARHILFWKADAPKEFHRLELPSLFRDMDLSADSLQLATAHYDRHLRISKLTPKA